MPEPEGGRTLSEAEIAAAVDSAPAQASSVAEEADKAIADVEALIQGGGEESDPAEAGDGAGKADGGQDGAGEAPAGESGEKPPAEAKPEEPGKQVPAADDKPVTVQLWDTDRQKRDQERANELKRLKDENEALKARFAAEPESKDAPVSKPADAKAEGNLKALKEKAKALASSDEATTEDWASLFSGTLEEVERLAARGQSSSEVEKLKAQVEQMASSRQEAERVAGLNRAQEQLNSTLERLDKEYAPQMRNKAVEIVKARLKEKGYSDENPAGLDTVEAYFEAAYAAVDRQNPGLRKGSKPAAKPAARPQSVRPDPGTGGGGQPAPRSGRLRDVAGEMLRAGKFG